jgi:hypothetical protein
MCVCVYTDVGVCVYTQSTSKYVRVYVCTNSGAGPTSAYADKLVANLAAKRRDGNCELVCV